MLAWYGKAVGMRQTPSWGKPYGGTKGTAWNGSS